MITPLENFAINDYFLKNRHTFANAIGGHLQAAHEQALVAHGEGSRVVDRARGYQQASTAGKCGLIAVRSMKLGDDITIGEYRIPGNIEDRDYSHISARYVQEPLRGNYARSPESWSRVLWVPYRENGTQEIFETETLTGFNTMLYERYRLEGKAYDYSDQQGEEARQAWIRLGNLLSLSGVIQIPEEVANSPQNVTHG